jgi:hypothetical protein
MPKTLFKVDLTKPMDQQELPGHNRWHPDIPAVVSVNPGEVFRIECKDWTDGQIKDNDSPDDIRDIDLTVVHVLSGPIWVNGAEPGDILVVDLLDIGALQGDEWGFTGIFDKKNGGGFLTDHFPNPAKAIWDLQGIYTSSRHIPGVKFAGITHPGLIGCAPSHELLATWNKREAELVATAPDLRTYGAGLSGDQPVLAALQIQSMQFWVNCPRQITIALRLRLPEPFRLVSMVVTATSRTYRKEHASTFQSMWKEQSCRWAIFTSRKAMERSHSAVRSRCRAISISTLISSKVELKSMAWSTPSSNPALLNRATQST